MIGAALVALGLGTAVQCEAAAAPERIVFFGDSLTHGLGVRPDQSYPSLVEGELQREGYRDVQVVNAGVDGETTGDALARLDQVLALRPSILVIELGANDALQDLSPQSARSNLEHIVGTAQNHGIRVLLEGIKPPLFLSFGYYGRFASIYPALAEEHHVPLVPSLLDGVMMHHDLNQADGLHPNAQGHRKVAATVLRYLRPMLPRPLAQAY